MRVPRCKVIGPGSAFHKVWRCHDCEYMLESHAEKYAYLEAINDDYKKHCSEEDFVLFGFCMMSNHGHEEGESTGQTAMMAESIPVSCTGRLHSSNLQTRRNQRK